MVWGPVLPVAPTRLSPARKQPCAHHTTPARAVGLKTLDV